MKKNLNFLKVLHESFNFVTPVSFLSQLLKQFLLNEKGFSSYSSNGNRYWLKFLVVARIIKIAFIWLRVRMCTESKNPIVMHVVSVSMLESRAHEQEP